MTLCDIHFNEASWLVITHYLIVGLFHFLNFWTIRCCWSILEVDAVKDEVLESNSGTTSGSICTVTSCQWHILDLKISSLSHLLLVAVALLPSTCLRNQFDWRALCDLTPSRSPSILSHTVTQCIFGPKKASKTLLIFEPNFERIFNTPSLIRVQLG